MFKTHFDNMDAYIARADQASGQEREELLLKALEEGKEARKHLPEVPEGKTISDEEAGLALMERAAQDRLQKPNSES